MSKSEKTTLGGGHLEHAILARIDAARTELTPPLPDKIAIEINNSCNHKCFFCPNPIMDRPRQVMDEAKVYRILDEARASGIREVSFYSTGEPLLNKSLPDYVRYAKKVGFSYVFLSTNGGRAVSGRLRPVLEAGVDSLKFSINAGTRETYAFVHGQDDFDVVLEHVALVDQYRKTVRPLRLFVSFVETPQSSDTFEALKERIGSLVDEVAKYPFIVIGTPLKAGGSGPDAGRPAIGYAEVDRSVALNQWRTTLPCYQLWSYLNVTVEGYLSACCSDFNDDLIVGNLNAASLTDAWHSPEFQELRRRHIQKRVGGTLCASCIAQRNLPYEPINTHLMSASSSRAKSKSVS